MSDQKLPQKIKKKGNTIKEEDKEKCNNYYSEVNKFIEKNQTVITKKVKEIDYFFEYGKENNCFISNYYDHQNLESYGYYNKKNKKIYLSIEEAFYLNQIGLISFNEEFDFNFLNLVKLNLYSYLRRSSKIPLVCKMILLRNKLKNIKEEDIEYKESKKVEDKGDIKDKGNIKEEDKGDKNKEEVHYINKKNNEDINIMDIDKYFMIFENIDDFKNNKIKSILYQHDSDAQLNFILFRNIINNAKLIYEVFKKNNEIKNNINNFPDVIIGVTQGISITFLKLEDKIEI